MNLLMKSIKNNTLLNKTELQTETSDAIGIVNNYVTAALFTALIMVGLFPKMSLKKNSNDARHYSRGLDRTLDEIQTRLNRGLQQWGNDNDQPDDYSTPNTPMRP